MPAEFLGQYRTKSVWRLCTPSACKFPVIFHKNAREYIKYSLRFLFHLTKNLTTHLSHNLCAVLPLQTTPRKVTAFRGVFDKAKKSPLLFHSGDFVNRIQLCLAAIQNVEDCHQVVIYRLGLLLRSSCRLCRCRIRCAAADFNVIYQRVIYRNRFFCRSSFFLRCFFL